MNNFAELLVDLQGKTLKNVVLTLCVGGKSERMNVANVVSVADLVELNIETVDHRSRDIQVRCFIRLVDIAYIVVPNQGM